MCKTKMNTKELVAVLFFLIMLGCSQQREGNIEAQNGSIKTEVKNDNAPDIRTNSAFAKDDLDELLKDSFTVEYRQLVNGYKVKAVVKINNMKINQADITFTKNGESFTLNTISFGDTLFNKGFWDTNENIIKIKKTVIFFLISLKK